MSLNDKKYINYLIGKIDREKRAREEAERLLELKSLALYDTNQQLQKSIVNLDNIVAERTLALKHAQQAAETSATNLKINLTRTQLILQASGAIIWDWDLMNDIFQCSLFDKNLFQNKKIINTYQDFLQLIYQDDRTRVKVAFEQYSQANSGKAIELQCRVFYNKNEYHWFHIVGQITADNQYMVGSLVDIHEKLENHKMIEKMAHYDALTDVANRSLFNQKIEAYIKHSNTEQIHFALMIIDLNDFKMVNDRYGHQVGDQVLINVASILKNHTKGYDLVSRLGGDEFAIILNDIKQEQHIHLFCKKVLDVCSTPMDVEGNKLSVKLSIGIAFFPRDADSKKNLIRNADMAMYACKQQSIGSSYMFYQEGFYLENSRKRNLRDELELAIEQNQFHLEYQPCVELSTGVCINCEALLRWKSIPAGYSIQDVVDIAEESGLILPLGEKIIDAACQFATKLKAKNITHKVGINLSTVQFQHQDIVEVFNHALRKHNVQASQLKVEVTENLLLKDIEGTILILQKLRSMGIESYIDDFGTGYSSLKYLQQLPTDWLKIDKSFIDGIEQDNANRNIIHAVIQMAHSIGLKVVAEGVETQQQYQKLKNINCDVVQGFYIAKSLTETKYIEWLIEFNHL